MKRLPMMVLVLVCLFSVAALAEAIVLSNGEWAPLLGKDLPHYGVASHIVSEAFALEGITVEYKWYGDSWKRAYEDAKTGKVVGSLVWSKKPEREVDMYYSDEVMPPVQNVFYYLKERNFDWNTVDDLKGLSIGGTLGFNYGSELEAAEKAGTITFDRVPEEPKNLKKLLAKRIDLFIVNKEIGAELIKTLSPEDQAKITVHPKAASTGVTYHLILTKAIPENVPLMEKFNAGLKKLIDSGKYEQMLKDARDGKYDAS